MILLGLLLALICIVIGIVAAAAPWFIGSLVASAIAGLLLWYRRNQTGAESSGAASLLGVKPSDESAGRDQVWVVDGRPTYHAFGCAIIADQPSEQIPLSQAHADGFIPCSVCTPSAAVS